MRTAPLSLHVLSSIAMGFALASCTHNATSPEVSRAQEQEVRWPVVFTSVRESRAFGIQLNGYDDAPNEQQKKLAYGCYGIGDGGPSVSFSEEALARFSKRGFSRRSLCMALMAGLRYNPESGARLPTFVMMSVEQRRQMEENGTPVEQWGPAVVSGEVPLDVPDCFKNGTPYSDCRFNYSPLTGVKSDIIRDALWHLGAEINDALNHPSSRQWWKEMTKLPGMEPDLDHPPIGHSRSGAFPPLSELLSLDTLSEQTPRYFGWNAISFVDYSPEFPRGFGYALYADGAAGPNPEVELLKLARQSKATSTQAILTALGR